MKIGFVISFLFLFAALEFFDVGTKSSRELGFMSLMLGFFVSSVLKALGEQHNEVIEALTKIHSELQKMRDDLSYRDKV